MIIIIVEIIMSLGITFDHIPLVSYHFFLIEVAIITTYIKYCRGEATLKSPKFEHIFVAVITFSPFFCANNYYISLLLIVCALR